MTKKDELYEQLLKEKERVIVVLTDHVDYLRQELALRPLQQATNIGSTAIERKDLSTPEQFEMDMQAWIREEEFDLADLVNDGKLTKEEADAAFAEINNIDFT